MPTHRPQAWVTMRVQGEVHRAFRPHGLVDRPVPADQTAVDFGLPNPGPQRLRMNPQLVSDPPDRPVADAGSRRASTAIRVARSLNSSLHFFGAATTLILPGMKASTRPGAIHSRGPGTIQRSLGAESSEC